MSEPAGNSPYCTITVPPVSRFEKYTYLGSRGERDAYLEVMYEEGDSVLYELALKDVKIARHISSLSRLMGLSYPELVKRIVPRYTFEQLMDLCGAVDSSDSALTVALEDEDANESGYFDGSEHNSDSPSDKL